MSSHHHRHLFFIFSLWSVVLIACLSSGVDGFCKETVETTDFKVSCEKKYSNQFSLIVDCLNNDPEAWQRLTKNQWNITHTKLFLRGCYLPESLNIYDLANSMGIENVIILILKDIKSVLHSSMFKNLPTPRIELTDSDFTKLPSDLLYYSKPQHFLITQTQLKEVPRNFFILNPEIRVVEISENFQLTRLKKQDFIGLENATDLLLWSNNIETIESGTFDHMINLQTLELMNNSLRILPPGMLKYAVNLQVLNLSINKIDELEADLLHSAYKTMQRFRMNHNEGALTSIPEGFFQNLTKLWYVEMVGSGLNSIPASSFENTYGLQSLNISNNSIGELPDGLFKRNNALVELWVAKNNLTTLPDGLFSDSNLERIYLDDNYLTELTEGMLMGLENLKVLDVSNNFLKFIHYDAYKLLKKIEYIDVSYNQLTLESTRYDGISVLLNMLTLKSLDAKYNNITQVFEDWAMISHLENVDLEGNLIQKITARSLAILNNRTTLNLKKNQISTIDLNRLKEYLEKLEKENHMRYRGSKVYAIENPLVCDCHLLELIKYTQKNLTQDIYDFVNFVDIDTVKCTAPAHLKGKTLKEVHWPDLRCEIKLENSVCNGTCVCWEYSGRQAVAVDCTSRGFHSFPEKIKNLEGTFIEIYLTYNSLTEVPHVNLLPKNISVLDLSFNNISNLNEEICTIDSLQQLKLNNNRLTRLDNNVLSRLQDHKSLTSLALHSNPWLCDCNTRDFLSFVQKNLVQLELHGISCAETGENFSTVTASEICSNASTITLTVCAVVVVIGVLAGWITAMCIKYKKHVKVWLYSKQLCLKFVTEEELDKDKQYDAFISYSHLDEDFVLKDLVPELESGSKPYQLCLHYRDWVIGEWIPAQIAHSVEESRRTIIVLSPNFLESVWGKIEFQTAHRQALNEGRARVIVILYGDVGNIQSLDPDLKAYLSMNTYIKWGDPWFWDRLRYALPHRRELSRTLKRTSNAQIIGNYLSTLQENENAANTNSESDSKCVEVAPVQEAETLLNVRHKDALMP